MDPDVTKMVAVLTVPQASLYPVTFDFYDSVRYEVKSRDCLDLCQCASITKNRGMRVVVVGPSYESHLATICLTLIMSKPNSRITRVMTSKGVSGGSCLEQAYPTCVKSERQRLWFVRTA